jgi:DUF971 family protein
MIRRPVACRRVACGLVEVPLMIDVGDGTGITVTWADERIDRIDARRLRAACPCAACGGASTSPPGVRVMSVTAVGGYAIAVRFEPGGHASGIFPFDLLRSLGTDIA